MTSSVSSATDHGPLHSTRLSTDEIPVFALKQPMSVKFPRWSCDFSSASTDGQAAPLRIVGWWQSHREEGWYGSNGTR
nr:hypothetical protein CFP56_70530 [Quercus suber]